MTVSEKKGKRANGKPKSANGKTKTKGKAKGKGKSSADAKAQVWRDLHSCLNLRGYLLPAAYLPKGQEPSAQTVASIPEDARLASKSDRLLIGTRKSDGTPVVFKWYYKAPAETEEDLKRVPQSHIAEQSVLARMLGPKWQNAPKNHCIRIFSWVSDNEGPRGVYVTPLLRRWNDAPLATVGEAVSMFAQLAEGLAHLHDNKIAWRTSICKISRDILHGPSEIHYARRFDRPRHHVGGRYYLADFNRSREFPDVTEGVLPSSPQEFTSDIAEMLEGIKSRKNQRLSINAVVASEDGRKGTPPDFAGAYPFANDVYNLGDFVSRNLVLKYKGLDWLKPLLQSMTRELPHDRPSMPSVIEQLLDLRLTRRSSSFRARLVPRNEPSSVGVKAAHLCRMVWQIVRGVKAAPKTSWEMEIEEKRAKGDEEEGGEGEGESEDEGEDEDENEDEDSRDEDEEEYEQNDYRERERDEKGRRDNHESEGEDAKGQRTRSQVQFDEKAKSE